MQVRFGIVCQHELCEESEQSGWSTNLNAKQVADGLTTLSYGFAAARDR